MRYSLEDSMDKTTTVRVITSPLASKGQYLRDNNTLGDQPYYWGSSLQASRKLAEYLEYISNIKTQEMLKRKAEEKLAKDIAEIKADKCEDHD